MPEEENNIIEIVDEDGNVLKCELYDIIEFENNQYALLIDKDSDEDSPELVIMKYLEDGEDAYFETIDDDSEFDRVAAYLETLEEDEAEDEE